jgi:hypothetical protein
MPQSAVTAIHNARKLGGRMPAVLAWVVFALAY